MRKRRYTEGDFGHKRWPRGIPVLQVAMAIEPMDDAQHDNEKPLRIVFHGAFNVMLRHVFGLLRNRLFRDFMLTEDMMTTIINGKCYHFTTVQIEQPDYHRLSLNEWPLIIKHLMEQTFRCEVTFFENYEKFLNT